ncbi:WXG100 family type VII secretion target [Streptomyces lunaelactis]|uniref:WXG100 family type VII secretion target n=1 Tax=Streptomyces lunaelactis TaxID=1535768 RepID=UPI0015855F0D|nr:WXG100 family type VII secretion target [Streptomyces lunaelactis]NUK21292.1 WXG100 family type VII secretion target [Streptomyces lunaelactis]NUK54588.1 WXG100 family type VII secretion target [Streptomyces lunaelactis]NUK68280.1 WXG100 family type VII secretion target [Streptomyces lunaelactis]
MSNIKVSPEEMREAASWMDNQRERMQEAIREAKNKIDHVVDNSYDTPQSKAKFEPMWDNYQRELESGVEEMRQISEFLKKTADAFVDCHHDGQCYGQSGDQSDERPPARHLCSDLNGRRMGPCWPLSGSYGRPSAPVRHDGQRQSPVANGQERAGSPPLTVCARPCRADTNNAQARTGRGAATEERGSEPWTLKNADGTFCNSPGEQAPWRSPPWPWT